MLTTFSPLAPKHILLLTVAAWMSLVASVAGTALSDMVCGEMVMDYSTCSQELVAYCQLTNWTDIGCLSQQVACPFAESVSGPESPCSVASCAAGSLNMEQCASAVETYCSYHFAQSLLNFDFNFDIACAGFTPAGCSQGQLRDCQGNCNDLFNLHDGTCDDGSEGSNWNCELFMYDGGDCPLSPSTSASASPSKHSSLSRSATASKSVSVSRTASASTSEIIAQSPSPQKTIVSASAVFKGITAAIFSLTQMLETFISLVAQEANVSTAQVIITNIQDVMVMQKQQHTGNNVQVDFYVPIDSSMTSEQANEIASQIIAASANMKTALNTQLQEADPDSGMAIGDVVIVARAVVVTSNTITPSVTPSPHNMDMDMDEHGHKSKLPLPTAAIAGISAGGFVVLILAISAIVLVVTKVRARKNARQKSRIDHMVGTPVKRDAEIQANPSRTSPGNNGAAPTASRPSATTNLGMSDGTTL